MTEALDTAIAAVVCALDAIDDPEERFQEQQHAGSKFEDELKGVRQRIALELKNNRQMKWREVGQIMGGVSAQRAEQISRKSR